MMADERRIMMILLISLLSISLAPGPLVSNANPEEPGAILTGIIYDQGLDEDGDGTYDFLEIGVQINVTESAYYGIELKGLTSGESVFMDIRPEINLDSYEVGLQLVYIWISGPWIYSYGLNPVNVSCLSLRYMRTPMDENSYVIEKVEQIPLSREYRYNEFDGPGAALTGVISDQGVDVDGDGTYDFLEIGVEVNVTRMAEYGNRAYAVSIIAYEGDAFVFAEPASAMELGVQLVTVRLDGRVIRSSNIDLIKIHKVILTDENGNVIWTSYDVPLSRKYLSSEFDLPGAVLTGKIHDRGVDIDKDGTFDQMEIDVEVDVTVPGYYHISAYRLQATLNESIYVGGYKYEFLDIGVHTVTISLDGPIIYISQMNPVNISKLQIAIGQSGSQVLREIPLSRKYLFTEFDKPQVAVGDWAKYTMKSAWLSTDPNSSEPNNIKAQKGVKWMKIEIQDISDTMTMLQTYCYQNGTETKLEPISGNLKTQFLTYVIPCNLQKGDRVPSGYFPFNPVDEAEGVYAGMKRNLIYANFTMSFFGMNISMKMYWDRSTGILCEMNSTVLSQVDDYVTSQSTSSKIIETNLWERVTSSIKIVDCGTSSSSVDLNKPVVVWYKAVYEHDGEEFNGYKGNLIVNDVTMIWSSTKQRWEMEFTSSEPKTVTFKVTGVQDNVYGLTAFNDAQSQPSVEWKQPGIPSYPFESILLGILLVVALRTRTLYTYIYK
jgi:hypothetical protein